VHGSSHKISDEEAIDQLPALLTELGPRFVLDRHLLRCQWWMAIVGGVTGVERFVERTVGDQGNLGWLETVDL
jgi:hypothetical protein